MQNTHNHMTLEACEYNTDDANWTDEEKALLMPFVNNRGVVVTFEIHNLVPHRTDSAIRNKIYKMRDEQDTINRDIEMSSTSFKAELPKAIIVNRGCRVCQGPKAWDAAYCEPCAVDIHKPKSRSLSLRISEPVSEL